MIPRSSIKFGEFFGLDNRLRLFCAVFAGAASIFISQAVFKGVHVTSDEGSYVFQANCFRDGLVSRDLPPIYPAFEHRMIFLRDGVGWMSRYQPGHALWLLPGVCLNAPRLMSALAAALSVWFLSGCASMLGVRPLIALTMLLSSPCFLLMHGTLLSHTSAHLFWVFSLWGFLGWIKTRRARYAVVWGFGWALLFLARSFTAVLICAPFALYALFFAFRSRSRPVWAGLAAAGFLAFLGALSLMIYNYLAVGDMLKSTYLAFDPSDALGFGMRHHLYFEGVEHTLRRGIQMTAERLGLMNRWAFGFSGSLVFMAVMSVFGWSAPWSFLLAASAVSVWAGYVFFFSTTPDNIGAYYYFETLPAILLCAAFGVQRVWERLGGFRRLRIALFSGCAAALLAGSFCFARQEAGRLGGELEYAASVEKTVRSARPDSLILLDGVLHCSDMVDNPLGLKSRPLIGRYWADENINLAIAKSFPDLTPYVMRAGAEERLVPFDRSRLIDKLITADDFKHYTGLGELIKPGCGVVAAREGTDPPGWMACGECAWIHPGVFLVGYEIACSNVAPDAPVTLDVIEAKSNIILAEKRLHGSFPMGVIELEFESGCADFIEFRVHYGGSGEAFFKSVRMREKP